MKIKNNDLQSNIKKGLKILKNINSLTKRRRLTVKFSQPNKFNKIGNFI